MNRVVVDRLANNLAVGRNSLSSASSSRFCSFLPPRRAVRSNTGVAADRRFSGSDVINLVLRLTGSRLTYLRKRGEVPLGSRLFLSEAGVGVAAVCAALNYWWFAPRMRDIQGLLADRYGAFHQADKADPLFVRFNGLHQTSTTLFMIGLAAAIVCLVCMTQFRSRQPNSQVVIA